jgi:hypothetical protein
MPLLSSLSADWSVPAVILRHTSPGANASGIKACVNAEPGVSAFQRRTKRCTLS